MPPGFKIANEVEWLGYDFLALGHWSLVLEGVFASPSYFGRWVGRLNRHGLMADQNSMHEFAKDYETAAAEGGVEPLPESVYGLEAIEIGRLPSAP